MINIGENSKIGAEVNSLYESKPFPSLARAGCEVYKSHGEYILNHKKIISRILFAGCGTCARLTTIASVISASQIIGMDFTKRSIELAKDYISSNLDGPGNEYLKKIRLFQGDILKIPENSRKELEQKFDWIESWGVIHHTSPPIQAFNNVASLLNPNGHIRVGLYGEKTNEARRAQIDLIKEFTSNLENIDDKIDWILKFMKTPEYDPTLSDPPLDVCSGGVSREEIADEFLHPHEYHFKLREIVEMFQSNDLDLIEITDFNNKPLETNLREYTDDLKLIREYESKSINGMLLSCEQADILERFISSHGFWYAVLGRKSK